MQVATVIASLYLVIYAVLGLPMIFLYSQNSIFKEYRLRYKLNVSIGGLVIFMVCLFFVIARALLAS